MLKLQLKIIIKLLLFNTYFDTLNLRNNIISTLYWVCVLKKVITNNNIKTKPNQTS